MGLPSDMCTTCTERGGFEKHSDSEGKECDGHWRNEQICMYGQSRNFVMRSLES